MEPMSPSQNPNEIKPDVQDSHSTLTPAQSQPIVPKTSDETQVQSITNPNPGQQVAPQPIMPWDRPDNQESPSKSTTVFGATQVQASGTERTGKKKILLVVMGIVTGLLLLGGGAAAAYFGIIVPNKPENVLRQALINTAQETEISTKGSSTIKTVGTGEDESMSSMKVTYEGKADTVNKQSEISLKLTMSGIDFPLDARFVDNNVYVKVGDIKTAMSLIGTYAGDALGFDPAELNPLITNVSNLVSNQWIEFDSTLLDTAGVSCVTNANFTLTDQDIKLLEDQFAQNSFAEIKSHSDDTVQGKSATKYELAIDNDKLTKFAENKKLEELSFIKALEKCPGFDEGATESEKITNNIKGTTALTLWVDTQSKRLSKIAADILQQDEQQGSTQGSFESTITYGNVSVKKPKDPKPAMQIWTELQQEFSSIFGSFSEEIQSAEDSPLNIDYPYNSIPQ